MNLLQVYPSQKISKHKKDREWKVKCLKYWNGFSFARQSKDLTIEKLFKIAAGIMDVTEYSHIQNPYHLVGEQFQKYPEKLRRYDIISPLFLRALREFKKRPFEPIVYTKNSNFDNLKQQAEKTLIEESLQRKFINMLVQTGQLQGQEQVEELSPDIIKDKVLSLKDEETISGQNILDYILDKDNIYSKHAMEFYHFLCSNRCESYADVRYDDVIRYTVHPMMLDKYGSNNVKFTEDYEVVRAKFAFTFEEIVDVFQGQDLSEYPDFFEYLESYGRSSTAKRASEFPNDRLSDYLYNMYGRATNKNTTSTYIDVVHTQWTSFRLVHFIPNGEEGFIEVDEDYMGDDIVYSEWKEEIREGYTIANKYQIGGDCVEFPRYDTNNPFKAKKNYTGLTFMNDMVQQLAIPEKIYQYQEAYDVIKFKTQYTINKNKDKLATIPLSLLRGSSAGASSRDKIDHKWGEDEEADVKVMMEERKKGKNHPIAETLYFADTTQLLFLDDSAPEAAIAVQMLKQIDLSLGNYIGFLIEYGKSIKAEAEDFFGFNRFVSGDISAKDSATAVQQGLQQSTAIIDLYYDEFEQYQQSDLQRLLDLSKYAYRTGKNLTYIRSNSDVVKLQVPENYSSVNHGIFVKNSNKTKEVLDILKNQANQFLQNGMQHSTFMKMISQSNNYASVIRDVELAENAFRQQEQQQAQADRDTNLQIAQMQSEQQDADRALEKYKIDINAEIAINKIISVAQASTGNDGTIDFEKMRLDLMAGINENQIKMQDIKTKKDIATQNNETKKYVADKQLAVAKENKPAKKAS